MCLLACLGVNKNMLRTFLISIAWAVFLGICWLPVKYFSINFVYPKIVEFGLTLILFFFSAAYPLGDYFGQKTKKFHLKWFSGVMLGTVSIGFSLSLLGFSYFFLIGKSFFIPTALSLLWLTMIIVSLVNGQKIPKIKQFDLTVNCSDLLHIIVLSDIHLNGLTSLHKMSKWVEMINQKNPDVILFTGDLIDIPIKYLEDELVILSKLKAKYAKLAVSGNHDFYTSDFEYPEALKKMGFQYLDNSSISIKNTLFVGLPDKAGKRHHVYRKSLKEILKSNSNQPVILLDHRPDCFEQSVKMGINLQFSGHTHWGQIPPWGLLVRLRYRYGVGLSKYKNAFIYTSKGTSVWGPSMRFWGRSEIVSIFLK